MTSTSAGLGRPRAWRPARIVAAVCLACAGLVADVAIAQPRTGPGPRSAAAPTYAAWAKSAREDILATLEKDGNADAAARLAESLLDSVIAYAPLKEAGAFREAALAVRETSLVAKARSEDRPDLAKLFRSKAALAEAVAWTVKPQDNVPAAMHLLCTLARDRADSVEPLANLAAAVCVVYDRPVHKVAYAGNNRNVPIRTPDALAVFDYFTANERRMAMDIRTLPPELLVFVVDMNEPTADWEWALAKYSHDRQIGRHYDDVHYDTSVLHTGTAKKWAAEGWSLQNILKGGGVCEDRAYFAAGIAKANGVPASYVYAKGAQSGHAWVGFLQEKGRSAEWNFDYGRFGEYEDLRGSITDPQTGAETADGTLELLSECASSDPVARHEAAGMCDAAARLAALRGKALVPAKPNLAQSMDEPRRADVGACLELLETGLRRAPAYVGGWELLAKLSSDEGFTLEQKRKWSVVLDNMCGAKYPDFSFATLRPMIRSVKDAKDRDSMWDWAAQKFKARPDLVAAARFEQGADCESRGDARAALGCYNDVITRFPNAGPAMVDALGQSAKLMEKGGRKEDVVGMYGTAWTRCTKPKGYAQEFLMQSNWFKVGRAYAGLLREEGRAKEAGDVEARLGVK